MSKKSELLKLLKIQSEASLTEAEQNRSEAQTESNRHIGRMESRYDTFKEESQYLADSYAREIDRLRGALEVISAQMSVEDEPTKMIGTGSVFTLEGDTGKKTYFLFTVGGGTRLLLEGDEYYVITPESVLGRGVLGKKVGDSVSIVVNEKEVQYRVTETA